MSEEGKSDAQQVKEILTVVADMVPNLVNQLKATLFSAEAGQELGRAVGAFYKELKEHGIPEDEALEMAKGYLGTLQSVMRQANVHAGQKGE